MIGSVPTGKGLSVQIQSFLGEAKPLVEQAIQVSEKSIAFRDIYKTSLAIDTIFTSLEDEQIQPSLEGMRTVALRIPLLISFAQTTVAVIEMRRFLELAIWSVFFTHHPIEWQHFLGARGKGFVRDPRLLIASAAHRELNSYLEYAREYMELEPSGFATKALSSIEGDKKILNAASHAGDIARSPASNVAMDKLDEVKLVKFAKLQRRLFTHCAILIAAFNRAGYEGFTPEARAHWQWLLGNKLQREIRAKEFGVYL